MLDGAKTKISAVALILWAIAGAVLEKHDWNTAITEILVACGILGLRIGMNNK